MISRSVIFFLLLCISGSALAIVLGGSNLGVLGYPDTSCRKPIKPFKPYSFNSSSEIDLYNNEVDLYNMLNQQYFSCVKEYLENAGNDIKRINEKMDEAIGEAKRPSF